MAQNNKAKNEDIAIEYPEPTKAEIVDGWLSVVGGISIHLFAGSFYLWGIMRVYIDSYFRYIQDPQLDTNFMNIVFPIISTLTGIFMGLGLYQMKYMGARLTIFTQGVVLGLGIFCSSYVSYFWQFFILFGCTFGVIRGTCYMIAHQVCFKYFEKQKGLISGCILFASGIATFPPSFVIQWIINPDNVIPTPDKYGNLNFPRKIAFQVPPALRFLGVYYFCLFSLGTYLLRERKTERIQKLQNYEKHLKSRHSYIIASVLKVDQMFTKKEIDEELEKNQQQYQQFKDEIDQDIEKDFEKKSQKQQQKKEQILEETFKNKQFVQFLGSDNANANQQQQKPQNVVKKHYSLKGIEDVEENQTRQRMQSQQFQLSREQREEFINKRKSTTALGKLSVIEAEDKPITVWEGVFSLQFFYLGGIIFFSGSWGYYIFSNQKVFGQTVIKDDRFLTLVGAVGCVPNGLCRVIWGQMYDKWGYKITYIILLTIQGLTSLIIYSSVQNKYLYMIVVTISFVCFGAVVSLSPPVCVRTFGMTHGLEIYSILFAPSWGMTNFAQYFLTLFFQKQIGYFWLFQIFTLFCFICGIFLYLYDPDYYTKKKKTGIKNQGK